LPESVLLKYGMKLCRY